MIARAVMLGGFLDCVCPTFCARLKKRPLLKVSVQIVQHGRNNAIQFARRVDCAVCVGVLHIGNKVPHYLLRGRIPRARWCVCAL